jgi:hypothetical protein
MASDAFISTPASGRRSGIPEWEQQRLLFTRLYVVERKTLKEVRQILAQDHGFHATSATTRQGISDTLLMSRRERMYKSRVAQWRIGKNHKVLIARVHSSCSRKSY